MHGPCPLAFTPRLYDPAAAPSVLHISRSAPNFCPALPADRGRNVDCAGRKVDRSLKIPDERRVVT